MHCYYSQFITRNSSGDEIANVNFLYDIVHGLENAIPLLLPQSAPKDTYEFGEITRRLRLLRRSRSSKVTEFGTNRKLDATSY